MAKNNMKTNKCPISGKGCINCPLYRGRHYNQCFQDHYGGDDSKGTGPLFSMGYLASGAIVKCDTCESEYILKDS